MNKSVKRSPKPTRAEFDRLVQRIEDLEDALVMRATENRGPTKNALPVALMERLLVGESPIRIWREHRGLSARKLATKAKVDPGYLSQIETGKKPGSAKALALLARALDVHAEDLAN